jgi:hypothetical protein
VGFRDVDEEASQELERVDESRLVDPLFSLGLVARALQYQLRPH